MWVTNISTKHTYNIQYPAGEENTKKFSFHVIFIEGTELVYNYMYLRLGIKDYGGNVSKY